MQKSRWKRELVQLNGKSEQLYNHKVSSLLMQSYAEIGAFPHKYHTWESPCSTHYNQLRFAPMLDTLYSGSARPDADTPNSVTVRTPVYNLGVSALEFDTKGAYLASVTRSRCLTLHKFESLCSHSNEFVRSRWKRELVQLNGKSEQLYNHKVSSLLMQSYAEIGAFPHKYHTWESPCSTHYNQLRFAPMLDTLYSGSARPDADTPNSVTVRTPVYNLGVSALEFDTKGAYLASVTRSRCLTLHKFESLCSHSNEFGKFINLGLLSLSCWVWRFRKGQPALVQGSRP
ncbi:hypothetical protein HanRHA438_Chr14g0668311 [Helianthus annuus]|nr:hypothetical protein HanRHA438_Chr14g0668311 [Helianthus annuus]